VKKKTIIFISSLVVICLIFILLYRNRTPFGKSNTSFASKPETEITRIELSDAMKKLVLEKKEDTWFLNGNTEARKNGVLFLIRILTELEIKSPVSPDLFDSVIIDKNIEPVHVRAWEKRKLLSSFMVFKTWSNVYGNIMKKKGSSKPFIIYIPDYEGNIGSSFTMNELFWLPYTIFNKLPSEIAAIDVENLKDTSDSFLITHDRQNYKLSDRHKDLSGWDSTAVARYLSYFTWIPFESWALEISADEKNKITSQPPLCRINVTDRNGLVTALTLWEKILDVNGLQKKDSDRLFGKTDSSDELFIVRYFDIDPLLKKRSYFFKR
jgi:hypothetical protein